MFRTLNNLLVNNCFVLIRQDYRGSVSKSEQPLGAVPPVVLFLHPAFNDSLRVYRTLHAAICSHSSSRTCQNILLSFILNSTVCTALSCRAVNTKEGYVLFNDALNTFYLRLYGVEGRMEIFYLTTHSTHFIYCYMVKDHSDSKRGNPLPPHRLLLYGVECMIKDYSDNKRVNLLQHGLLFPISSKDSFICNIPHTG